MSQVWSLIFVLALLHSRYTQNLRNFSCQVSNRPMRFFRVAENGDVKTLKAFLACSIQPKENFIVLAAYNGRSLLLQYCVTELKMSKDSSDMYDRTPLLRAVEAGRENIVE